MACGLAYGPSAPPDVAPSTPHARRSTMAPSRTLSVGMDVHQESIAGASVAHAYGAAGVSLGTVGTRQCDIDKRIQPLQSKGQQRVVVYEAGPWGDGLSPDLAQQGYGCWVVAPSWIPQKTGDRVNTDRRDTSPWA